MQRPLIEYVTLRIARSGTKARVSVSVSPDAPTQAACVVLTLDKSGSMSDPASNSREMRDYSKMLLVKHAAKIAVGGLLPGDRAAIFAYDNFNHILLPPTLMDDAGKKKAMDVIADPSFTADGGTDMWVGLEASLQACLRAAPDSPFVAMLTDGVPSHSPYKGEPATIVDFRENVNERCLGSNARINIIGLGTDVNSALLAKMVSNDVSDSFAMMPDASMVIPTMSHVMAYEMCVMQGGASVKLMTEAGRTIDVGTLYVGQVRDFLIDADEVEGLALHLSGGRTVVCEEAPAEGAEADAAVAAEVARVAMIEALSSASRTSIAFLAKAKAELVGAVRGLTALDPDMLEDVVGEVSMALATENAWLTWGQHYLRALISAHHLQKPTNPKDKGLQAYGGPAFRAQLARLGAVCDNIERPMPDLNIPSGYRSYGGGASVGAVRSWWSNGRTSWA